MIVDHGVTIVEQEANATIIVRSRDGAYNDDGEWIADPANDTHGVRAVVQPASGRALRDLPEGTRSEARHFLWTRFPLAEGNVVIYAGAQWRVLFIWDRQIDAGYTKAAMGRMTKQ